MSVKFTNDRPIFLQLADLIKKEIVNYNFEPGEKLPTVREYAFKFQINPNTVQKALQILEDENLIVVNKPRKIETVSESGENDLCLMVGKQINQECYPVHRLDRNTEGLVIFAKNSKTKKYFDYSLINLLGSIYGPSKI